MWHRGQWLWDRETKKPVQFVGVEMLFEPTKGALFHVKEIREVQVGPVLYEVLIEIAHPFNGAEWWKNRYTELYIPNLEKQEEIIQRLIRYDLKDLANIAM